MITALRVGLALGGLLLVYVGCGFLTSPVSSAANFGIATEGAHGLTSIRSDFTAFFCVGGGCFIWGAWARRSDPLTIGAALMLVTLATRLVSLSAYGSFEGYVAPMVVVAVLGIFGLVGARVLPKKSEGLARA